MVESASTVGSRRNVFNAVGEELVTEFSNMPRRKRNETQRAISISIPRGHRVARLAVGFSRLLIQNSDQVHAAENSIPARIDLRRVRKASRLFVKVLRSQMSKNRDLLTDPLCSSRRSSLVDAIFLW